MLGTDYVTAEQKAATDRQLSKQRAAIQLFSAAQEAVALGQSLGDFLAMASIAHAQATKRAQKTKGE